MIPGSSGGRIVALAVLFAIPAGAAAQQGPPPAPTQQQGAPEVQQPAGIQAPAPVQPAQRPEQQDAAEAPKRLGRPFPAAVPPPPPTEEPGVSVSIVEPQESPVFGRRKRSGNEPSLQDRRGGGPHTGDVDDDLDGQTGEPEVDSPAE